MSLATDTLRARNMRKRRARLLAEARGLLARGGFEALNLRELARLADVTVPTIYNLIGKKEDLLLALGAGVLTELESRIAPAHEADPLTLAAAVVVESTGLFAEDEDFHRAAFLAVEWLDQGGQHHDEVARIYDWVGELISTGIAACRAARLLRGRVAAAMLSDLIMRNFRMSCRGWAFGHYGIDEFRRMALCDLYIALAADAVETFQLQLLHKITELTPDDTVATSPARSARNNRGDST
ncbi:MAG: TetR/AcrR family transcriptional regulator [Gammaproteobacteria bacterium]